MGDLVGQKKDIEKKRYKKEILKRIAKQLKSNNKISSQTKARLAAEGNRGNDKKKINKIKTGWRIKQSPRKARIYLADSYVKSLIRARLKIPYSDIPPELIELYRLNIIAKRRIRSGKNRNTVL